MDWQSVDATEPQKIQQWDEVLGVAGESGGNNLEDEFDSPEPFNLDTPSSTEGRDPDALVIWSIGNLIILRCEINYFQLNSFLNKFVSKWNLLKIVFDSK